MSLRERRGGGGYTRIAQHDDYASARRRVDDDDHYTRGGRHDPRFDAPPDEVPAGSVALAAALTLFGACSLVLAWLHWTQAVFGKEQAEVGFTIVGLLTIVPGAYHSWIALCVWLGVDGYRWSDIPSYD